MRRFVRGGKLACDGLCVAVSETELACEGLCVAVS